MKKVIALERSHFKILIDEAIDLNGIHCSLNHIDISRIYDMFALFAGSEFNGDISEWNTSHVLNMSRMFYKSKFKGDL